MGKRFASVQPGSRVGRLEILLFDGLSRRQRDLVMRLDAVSRRDAERKLVLLGIAAADVQWFGC